MKVVLQGNNPSRWANLVPKFKEVEEETRRPAENWDKEVSAREEFIPREFGKRQKLFVCVCLIL